MTAMLTASIVGVLKAYSIRTTLNTRERHAFNAIITGLSVGLSLNLIASLKSYAKMLRWRLLATGYRTLEQFELIMGCDQQINVVKLIFKSWRPKYWFIPSVTQVLCLLWVSIFVGAAILVAVLGLTYSLEQSTLNFGIISGNVSIVDFSYIGSLNTTESTYYTELGAAHTYGILGQDYTVYPVTGDITQGYAQSIEADPAYPVYSEYWFGDENPTSVNDIVMTGRYVNVTSFCDAYPVINDYFTDGNVTYFSGLQNITVNVLEYAAGGLTFIADTNSTCGDRCTNLYAFQPSYISDADPTADVTIPQFFICNNTVGQLQNLPEDSTEAYKMPDLQARMLAGGIGWEGLFTVNVTTQYQVYPVGVPQVPPGASTADDVSRVISQFTSKAIAAMDDRGPRRNVSSSHVPVSAVYLKVTWKWAIPVLALIPGIHFLTLAAVIIWANKAIIKDETFLSMAKLYAPLVEGLGPHGCLMRGDQIIKRFGNPMVAYGFKDCTRPGAGGVKHVDLFRQEDGVDVQRSFQEGDYDGDGWEDEPVEEKQVKVPAVKLKTE